MKDNRGVNRRDFVKAAVGAGLAMGAMSGARPAQARIPGSNDRINWMPVGSLRSRYALKSTSTRSKTKSTSKSSSRF